MGGIEAGTGTEAEGGAEAEVTVGAGAGAGGEVGEVAAAAAGGQGSSNPRAIENPAQSLLNALDQCTVAHYWTSFFGTRQRT